jgi:hypothetical protein
MRGIMEAYRSIIENLQAALVTAEASGEGKLEYFIERAIDVARAAQIDLMLANPGNSHGQPSWWSARSFSKQWGWRNFKLLTTPSRHVLLLKLCVPANDEGHGWSTPIFGEHPMSGDKWRTRGHKIIEKNDCSLGLVLWAACSCIWFLDRAYRWSCVVVPALETTGGHHMQMPG